METIGILGGMGPDATNLLCQLITRYTESASDQDHIPVICFNNSAIPSRTDALTGNGMSPLPELIRTAQVLQSAGANFLVMPCNTAHYYFEDIQASVEIPIIHMIEETVQYVVREYPNLKNIGLLASTATVDCQLFHRSFAKYDIDVTTPFAQAQADLVMESIFGRSGIKAGFRKEPQAQLLKAAAELRANGAQALIAGCTEISTVLAQDDLDIPLIDPLRILALLAIRRATAARSLDRLMLQTTDPSAAQ